MHFPPSSPGTAPGAPEQRISYSGILFADPEGASKRTDHTRTSNHFSLTPSTISTSSERTIYTVGAFADKDNDQRRHIQVVLPGSDVRMEQQQPPPPTAAAPPYGPAQPQPYHPQQQPSAPPPPHATYEYVPADAIYHVDHTYEQHGGHSSQPQQPYYVTNSYSTHYVQEVPADARYVVENPQSGSIQYYSNQMDVPQCNGYSTSSQPQPSTSAQYLPPGYAQQPPPPGTVYVSTVPSGYPGDPHVVHRAYPPSAYPQHRNVTQILNASRTVEHGAPSGSEPKGEVPQRAEMDGGQQKPAAKPAKKRSSATNMAAMPSADPSKMGEAKKQFQCPDCQKFVSSARNLKRHESSCKAKKGGAAPASGEKPPSAPTPSKPASQAQPVQMQKPPGPPPPAPAYTVSYPPHPSQQLPPNQMVYQQQHMAPPRYQNYGPHTALPQDNNQPMFEYPSSGMNGLHSAPPVMNNYAHPVYPASVQQGTAAPPYQQQRQAAPPPPAQIQQNNDFGDSQFGFNAGMDSFIENAIDEMAHNPLAFIGDYEGGNSGEHSMSNSEYQNLQPMSRDDGEPKLLELGAPAPMPPKQPASVAKAPKQPAGEKNTKPTNFGCSDCGKFMCSQRSLRRHLTTCKEAQKRNGGPSTSGNPPTDSSSGSGLTPKPGNDDSQSNLSVETRSISTPFSSSQNEERPSEVAGRKPSNAESAHSFGPEKTLMPPPEAQEPSRPTKVEPHKAQPSLGGAPAMYVKAEGQGTVYVDLTQRHDSMRTIGEHLRQIHGKPGGSVAPKKIKRPHILNRKPKIDPAEHNESKDDASGSDAKHSSQVADVVDSVVEKMRKSAYDDQQVPIKRPAPATPSLMIAGPSTKILKLDAPPRGTMRALMSGQSMGPGPHLVQARPVMHPAPQQRPPSTMMVHHPPSGYGPPMEQHQLQVLSPPTQQAPPPHQAPPQQVQEQSAAPLTSPDKSKPKSASSKAKYLCPECARTYSCRKNMKTHRINVHNLTEQDVEVDNPAKRVKFDAEGLITNPGYERENALIRERLEAAPKNEKKGRKTPKKSSVPNKPSIPVEDIQVAPMPASAPPMPQPSQAFYYMNEAPPSYAPPPPHQQQHQQLEPLNHHCNSSPQYEQLRPVPMDYAQNVLQPDSFARVFTRGNEDLDAWEQIKNRVDGPFNHSQSDEMDVARIAADLKRSAEESQAAPETSYHQLQVMYAGEQQQQQLVVESRKPVELAEADSTFCEELEDAVASSTMSMKPHPMLGGYPEARHYLPYPPQPHSAPAHPAEHETTRIEGHWAPHDSVDTKAKKVRSEARKRECPSCGKQLASDYSLRRHAQKCKSAASNAAEGQQSDPASNDSVPPETSTDDSHSADPDSTTINPPTNDSAVDVQHAAELDLEPKAVNS